MSELYSVSSSPHIRSKVKTSNIMLMVIIALLPATAFGVYNFGFRALMLICVSIASCVATEFFYQHFMKKTVTVGDYSAILTGLLLALNLPSGAPWWMPMLGGVFAILVVKQVFGGLGQNFMNPALAARCFLMISFAGRMTDFTYTGKVGATADGALLDSISGATPLALIKAGEQVDVMKLFLGTTTGTIGETSALALLIGAAFLLAIKVIDLRVPGAYILSFTVFIIIFGGHGLDANYILGHLFGGGLMLGAWFMATDYVTTPITKSGQIVYGIIIGLLTGIFRLFGGTAEGVSYAIIISNLMVPLIERVTVPPAFGQRRAKNE